MQGSIPQLPEGLGGFDTFLLLGNNLGLLAGWERAPAVLRSLAAVARPGARLYGSGVDPYATRNEALTHVERDEVGYVARLDHRQ